MVADCREAVQALLGYVCFISKVTSSQRCLAGTRAGRRPTREHICTSAHARDTAVVWLPSGKHQPPLLQEY